MLLPNVSITTVLSKLQLLFTIITIILNFSNAISIVIAVVITFHFLLSGSDMVRLYEEMYSTDDVGSDTVRLYEKLYPTAKLSKESPSLLKSTSSSPPPKLTMTNTMTNRGTPEDENEPERILFEEEYEGLANIRYWCRSPILRKHLECQLPAFSINKQNWIREHVLNYIDAHCVG